MSLHHDRLLTRDEVAEHFGLSKRFLEVSKSRSGGPAYIRFGRSIRYRVADVRAWVEAHRIAPEEAEPR